MTKAFKSDYLEKIYEEVMDFSNEQVVNRKFLASYVVDKVNRSYGNGRRHGKREAKAALQNS